MFKRATAFTLISFAAMALIWVFQICFVTDNDLAAYRKRIEETQKDGTSESLTSTTNQTRQGVRKDIWFAGEDHSRLQYRIESESSLLSFLTTGEKVEVVENLENIKCWMQDRLYVEPDAGALQQIRFLQAAQGIYRYSTQEFLAQTVTLSLFRLPGHTLITTSDPKYAFLKGIAKDVSFSVSGKNPHFQAQHFSATFKQKENDL